jgi:ABC-type antimicrobial peptide transport system permease subunit
MALGAQRAHVLRIVFASMLVNVGGGIIAGIVLRMALTRAFVTWADSGSRDPVILMASALLLTLVAGTACALPALRASKIEPMSALRCE